MFEVGKKYVSPSGWEYTCIGFTRDNLPVFEYYDELAQTSYVYRGLDLVGFSSFKEVKELKKYSTKRFLYPSSFSHNRYFIFDGKLETYENLGEFILDFEIDEEENKIVNVSARLSSDT